MMAPLNSQALTPTREPVSTLPLCWPVHDLFSLSGPSRRGDMEILGYCLLQWASGDLPWEDNLTNKPYVAAQKLK